MLYMRKFAENDTKMDMGGSREGLFPKLILSPILQK